MDGLDRRISLFPDYGHDQNFTRSLSECRHGGDGAMEPPGAGDVPGERDGWEHGLVLP